MPIEENTRHENCGCQEESQVNCDLMAELKEEIRCCQFAITDLSLYLDTHPNDRRALCLHRNQCNHLRELSDRYQKMFGPLTITFPCNKWRWLEEPWPWEGSEF